MDYSLCTLILLLYVTHDHGLISPAAAAGRILLLPFEHLAHERYFNVAGRALRRSGHEVHVLLARPQPFLTRDFPDLTHIVPRGLKTPSVFDVDFVNLMFANGGDPMKVSGIVAQNSLARCKEILTQEDVMNTMETARYDLVIVDGLEPASCYYSIPYRLGVKYITLTPRANPWAAAVPALPSVEPVWGATFDPANSTVTERALNLLQYLKQYLFLPPVIFSDDLISQYAPEKPPTSFRELYSSIEVA